MQMLSQELLDVGAKAGILHVIENLIIIPHNQHDKLSVDSQLILLGFVEFSNVSWDTQTTVASDLLPTRGFNENSHQIFVKVTLKLPLLQLISFKIFGLEGFNLLSSSMEQ